MPLSRKHCDNESPAAPVAPCPMSSQRLSGDGLNFLELAAEDINDKIYEFIRDKNDHFLDDARHLTNRLLRRVENQTKQLDALCQKLMLRSGEFDATDAEDLATLLKGFWLPAIRNGVPVASKPDTTDPKHINAQNIRFLARCLKEEPLERFYFKVNRCLRLVVTFCVEKGSTQQWRGSFEEIHFWMTAVPVQDQEEDVKPSEI